MGRQKLARREREKRRKANDRADRDTDAEEPEAPSSGATAASGFEQDDDAAPALESSPGTAAAPSAPSSGFEVEEDAATPVRGSASSSSSSSSSRRTQELEYELDVRTRAAQADHLLLQRRVDDAELKFLTQKAMTADESTRRQKLEMAAAAQALKDKKELDRARLAQAQLEEHAAAAAARTHLAYRETVLKDLQHKNRDVENRLQIEQDASRRSDRRLVAQVVEEKGKRIALELQLEKQQRKK